MIGGQNAAAPGFAELVPALVTGKSATTMTINVGGTSFNAAFVDLGALTPVVGDLAIAGRYDSTWVVWGRQGGVGANSVLNPSFEADGATPLVPSQWNRAVVSGTGAVSVVATGYAPNGSYELSVFAAAGATQDTYVYSNPINVAPGQVWAVSAFTSAVYPTGAPITATGNLYGLWFANATNLYPTTSAADSLIASVVAQPAPTHVTVSGNVTVPAATSYMRVGTRSGSAAGVTVLWDLVIARRVS